jgi:glutathione S-transferase
MPGGTDRNTPFFQTSPGALPVERLSSTVFHEVHMQTARPPIDLQLHVDAQYTSPYAMSVFVTLREKDLPFALHTVDLDAAAHHDPAYAALSLTARVPTLQHGELALSESRPSPNTWKRSSAGRRSIPPISSRARARQVQAWLRSDLLPAHPRRRNTQVLFYGARKPPCRHRQRPAAQQLFRFAEALLPQGRGAPLRPVVHRRYRPGIDDQSPGTAWRPGTAASGRLCQAQWQRPSVQEWVAMQRPPLTA